MSHRHRNAETPAQFPGTEPVADAHAAHPHSEHSEHSEAQEHAQDAEQEHSHRPATLAKLKTETRAGVAIVLSFLILVGVLVYHRTHHSTSAAKSQEPTTVAETKAPAPGPARKKNSSPPPIAAIGGARGPASAKGQARQTARGPSGQTDESPNVPPPSAAMVAERGVSTPAGEEIGTGAPPPPAVVPSLPPGEPPPDLARQAPVPPPTTAGVPLAPDGPAPPSAVPPPIALGASPAAPGTTEANPPLPPEPPAPATTTGVTPAETRNPPPVAALPQQPTPGPVEPPPPAVAEAAAPPKERQPLETASDPLASRTATDAAAPAPVMNNAPPPPRALPPGIVAPAARSGAPDDWVTLPNMSESTTSSDRDRTRMLASARTLNPGARPPTEVPEGGDGVEPVRHVVQKGENFWTISKLYYGSGRYYKALWAANRERVSAPDRLIVGTAIRVPPPEALDRALVEPPGAAGTAASGSSSTPRRARPSAPLRDPSEIELALPVSDGPQDSVSNRAREDITSARVEAHYPRYQVKPHDTLRSIARDMLGDSHRADEILDMNKDTIPDPKRLTAGQVLYLPEDARMARARR